MNQAAPHLFEGLPFKPAHVASQERSQTISPFYLVRAIQIDLLFLGRSDEMKDEKVRDLPDGLEIIEKAGANLGLTAIAASSFSSALSRSFRSLSIIASTYKVIASDEGFGANPRSIVAQPGTSEIKTAATAAIGNPPHITSIQLEITQGPKGPQAANVRAL